jgi:hypothetical protein
MEHKRKKMGHGKMVQKDGNALARREPMTYGGMGMKKKPMEGGGRIMYGHGGEVMPKAKPC